MENQPTYRFEMPANMVQYLFNILAKQPLGEALPVFELMRANVTSQDAEKKAGDEKESTN